MTANQPTSLDDRLNVARQMVLPRQQDHLLRWWDELEAEAREQLLGDLESIPWTAVDPLIATHVRSAPPRDIPTSIEPAVIHPHTPPAERAEEYQAARQLGEKLLREGKVAAFTVAGGQGTRLGYDGPKGEVVVTPTGDLSLFALFAGMVKRARAHSGAAIPWYIMTSPANHARTVDYLEERDFFGLPREDVMLFSQGMLPAFDREGKVLLAEKHRVALAPDGHGGSLKALVSGGAIVDMRRRGVEIISYFQVDNPLVKPFDPLFIGLHRATGSEMSSKVTPKADDLERVGNICSVDGKVTVIEYSELPEELARARDEQGRRRFDAGSLAIHMLSVDFVDRIVGESFQLPYRRADKKVPFVDETGALMSPGEPNGVKLETFVFDALPLASHSLVLEVERAEEFSPVKNASGVDSLETSQRDQVRRACRWLEQAGVKVPRTDDGEPAATVVIAPTFALDAADVAARKSEIPAIKAGDTVVLS
jgi:UDP-N-acetylglucosamine/UDP-N-acetylgalactosamine diphosphorylase